ncbi:hypothetical protein A2U01_0076334, partial [Trifolium medium]|nr:hypothetical protein [Trifolium medium]
WHLAPFLRSSEVAWRGGGEEVASGRQPSPVGTFLPDLHRYLPPCETER